MLIDVGLLEDARFEAGKLGDFLFTDELENAYLSNLIKLLEISRKYGLTYISLGPNDLMGVENIRAGGWPAIWQIAKDIGFDSNCGNNDQYQISGKHFFHQKYYGLYNVITRKRLIHEPLSLMGRHEQIKRFIKTGILSKRVVKD